VSALLLDGSGGDGRCGRIPPGKRRASGPHPDGRGVGGGIPAEEWLFLRKGTSGQGQGGEPVLLARALRLGVVRRDYFFVDFLAAGLAAAFAAGLTTAFAAGFLAAGLAAAGLATTFFFAAIKSHLPSMPKGHEWKICFGWHCASYRNLHPAARRGSYKCVPWGEVFVSLPGRLQRSIRLCRSDA